MKYKKFTDSSSLRDIKVMKKFYDETYFTKITKGKDKQGYTIYNLLFGNKR